MEVFLFLVFLVGVVVAIGCGAYLGSALNDWWICDLDSERIRLDGPKDYLVSVGAFFILLSFFAAGAVESYLAWLCYPHVPMEGYATITGCAFLVSALVGALLDRKLSFEDVKNEKLKLLKPFIFRWKYRTMA